jgi:membrane protease YdiL (CAAX protease family)
MPGRPTLAEFLRARQAGVCPWCHAPIEVADGVEPEFCASCGHHTRAPLGPPDPGNRSRARWAALLALVLILAVAVVQQFGDMMLSPPAPVAGAIEPPSSQFELTGRVFVKINEASPNPSLQKSALSNLQSDKPEDKLRAAMAAGELVGPDEALARLNEIEPKLAPDSPLVGDVAVLRDIYNKRVPDPAAMDGLKDRHGYFARLASVFNAPKADPERERVTGGGMALVVFIFAIGLVGFSALVTGFILLVFGIVNAASGKLRPAFVPPAPGGSAAIEVVAVFVLGFLLLKGVSYLAESSMSARQALWFGLIGQWVLIVVVLWPRFMGAPRGRGMTLLGWHKGEGVAREIGCGVMGYLACLPLLIGGAVVSVILVVVHGIITTAMGGKAPPAPENPVLDIASGKAGVLVVVVIYLLATLWAPIVEETVFRGGLYRHLRSRWRWFGAAAVTALGFGIMHAYPVLLLGPVIALGFGFAMLREWRGSLIASMTAHCIHNALVLGVLLTLMRLVGG